MINMGALFDRFHEHKCPWCAPHSRYPASCYTFPMPPSSMHGLKNRGETEQFRADIRSHVQRCSYQTPVSWKTRVPVNVLSSSVLAIPGRAGKKGRSGVRKVCVGLLFVRPLGSPDQDIDNTTKAFLDAVKGEQGLLHDDMEIVHLECFKAESHPELTVTIPAAHRNSQGIQESVTVGSFIAIRIQSI